MGAVIPTLGDSLLVPPDDEDREARVMAFSLADWSFVLLPLEVCVPPREVQYKHMNNGNNN